MELKKRKSKKRRNNKGIVCKVWKKKYNCEKGVKTRKERDFISRIQDRKKKRVVELEGGNILHRGKNTAKQYVDRGSKRGSKRER